MNTFIFSLKHYGWALSSALLFGLLAPLTKYLTLDMPPLFLAATLYAGAGIGLLFLLLLKGQFQSSRKEIKKTDLTTLLLVIITGGVMGPICLTHGLLHMSGSSSSLLLNLEAVFTAFIAWFVFKEHFEKKIFLGLLSCVFASLLLAILAKQGKGQDTLLGFLFITGACLSWGLDNNFTRKISHLNPIFLASIKGCSAGFVNFLLSWSQHEPFHFKISFLGAIVLGFFGIGLSLVAFINSLRTIGTSRTGAIFSAAPFIGSLFSFFFFHESLSFLFLLALAFMLLGFWPHFTEDHGHEHTHGELEHTHEHSHDDHHQHSHDDMIHGKHTHSHLHTPLTHTHKHFPDIHHRHGHHHKG